MTLPIRVSPESGMTVDRLAEYLGTPIVGDPHAGYRMVRDLVDDSRTVRPGDAYLAIPGSRWHGLDFEHEVAAAGAVLAISDRPSSVLPTLIIDEPRKAMGPLASWFHDEPSRDLRVFGVTGTNGKTSTTHFIDAALTAAGESAGLISGARIRGPGYDLVPTRTTPEAPMLQRTLATFRRHGVTGCAMEVSSHAVDQHRVDGTAFRVMAFANLSDDHLDYHGSMESYFATKACMFTVDRTQIAAISIDDDWGARLAAGTAPETWTCSAQDAAADVYATDIRCADTGTRFTAHTPYGVGVIHLQTLGPHQVANALLALTSVVADGVDVAAAAEGISSVTGVAGRCEPVHAGQSFVAIVDYMHNTAGQHALLPYLKSLASGRLILVVGATGGRDPGKRRPLGQVAAQHSDVVIVTDESPEDEDPDAIRTEVLRGARLGDSAVVVEEPDRRAALTRAVSMAGPDDIVVVTGRGSDTFRRYGPHTSFFDDQAELRRAIVKSLDTQP
ncbi:UDP-N-acetylmuramoyl-L-alanyl-D-glutamate--2,6-diaminopimelate ligase [Gordonia rubripertincta]|uniref:UDP-N-acetylmuramyl-tripeptide synthetase n=2 Tax=Gordonia rubripertincta TaxID=36822 RepID=A0AAW6RB13_GORRU|nr:UDP-N-acetylmuramoyl-L-alanyl-D-glutamate--2,6-diaminopimelate ligase [Gordonia rubripertincta]MDG6781585.1 UDP-N-acetylmuramoyl-L-alanyl-D-glutamate--2,6-diaminopimelate ligase [Gordonia rubripertincta]NKY64265.1 UDP-N-acetylmuramoyl-L-alanyl-D-glutamate--2,6-diaminopimelate ligase [Gordonia rubripertincta]GAB85431.1 UDP-N-acetylmuramoyl-L-alanyl-D-glutamate--2,6-diaminopimelate ligase [Gordonia rubripertincta NBRC 101908]